MVAGVDELTAGAGSLEVPRDGVQREGGGGTPQNSNRGEAMGPAVQFMSPLGSGLARDGVGDTVTPTNVSQVLSPRTVRRRGEERTTSSYDPYKRRDNFIDTTDNVSWLAELSLEIESMAVARHGRRSTMLEKHVECGSHEASIDVRSTERRERAGEGDATGRGIVHTLDQNKEFMSYLDDLNQSPGGSSISTDLFIDHLNQSPGGSRKKRILEEINEMSDSIESRQYIFRIEKDKRMLEKDKRMLEDSLKKAFDAKEESDSNHRKVIDTNVNLALRIRELMEDKRKLEALSIDLEREHTAAQREIQEHAASHQKLLATNVNLALRVRELVSEKKILESSLESSILSPILLQGGDIQGDLVHTKH